MISSTATLSIRRALQLFAVAAVALMVGGTSLATAAPNPTATASARRCVVRYRHHRRIRRCHPIPTPQATAPVPTAPPKTTPTIPPKTTPTTPPKTTAPVQTAPQPWQMSSEEAMSRIRQGAQAFANMQAQGDSYGGQWSWELKSCSWYQASSQYKGVTCLLRLIDRNPGFCEMDYSWLGSGRSWSFSDFMISAYPDQNGSHYIDVSEPTPLHEYICYS